MATAAPDRDGEAWGVSLGADSDAPAVLRACLQVIDARDLLIVTLARAQHVPERRCWFVALRPATGGRLIAGGILNEAGERMLAGRLDAQTDVLELSSDALVERLVAAAERTREARMAVRPDLRRALELILPAGAVPDLPLLPDAGSDELRVGALDDGLLFELMSEWLADFERWTAEDPGNSVWRSGDLVGGAMIEFKGRYADGLLGRWTVADVREFMLTWLPGMVQTDADVAADIPDCICAFLRLLSQRGSLSGDPLTVLESEVRSAAARLPERFAEVQRSGLAEDVARHLRGDET